MNPLSLGGPLMNVYARLRDPALRRRQVVHRLFMHLIDRRMLFDGACGTNQKSMIRSAEMVRANLRKAAGDLESDDAIISYIAYARDACHRFQTFLEARSEREIQGPDRDVHHELNQLRMAVRYAVTGMGERCGVAPPKELIDLTRAR